MARQRNEPEAEPEEQVEAEAEEADAEAEPEGEADEVDAEALAAAEAKAADRAKRGRTERNVAEPYLGPGFDHDDTPSALALKKAGGDGDKYQAVKKRHRWG